MTAPSARASHAMTPPGVKKPGIAQPVIALCLMILVPVVCVVAGGLAGLRAGAAVTGTSFMTGHGATIQLEGATTYTIVAAGADTKPADVQRCGVVTAFGEDMAVTQAGGSSAAGQVNLFSFTTKDAGNYTITCVSAGSPVSLTLIQGGTSLLVRTGVTVLIAIGVAALAFVAGLIVLIVWAVRRSTAKKHTTMPTPPPYQGYPDSYR